MELTNEQEYLKERKELIDEIRSLGKNYKFEKYTNKQLWHIRNKTRLAIAKQEQECLEIAKQYYKEKEMGIPNYIEKDGIFYVWNDTDLEYQPLEEDYDFYDTLTEAVKTRYMEPKVLRKTFYSNIMNRFTKVV